jgi:tRNA1(Val) A37 N6-methylase TrmN6
VKLYSRFFLLGNNLTNISSENFQTIKNIGSIKIADHIKFGITNAALLKLVTADATISLFIFLHFSIIGYIIRNMPKKQDFFTILDGRVKFTSDTGYKVTSDAIWLAESIETAKNSKILDVGIGTGGVSLCMLDKNPDLKITGIDVSEKMITDATENAKLNNRTINIINADILNWKTNALFDCVVTNPPYFSGTERMDKAHHNIDVYKWVSMCTKRLRSRGTFHCIVCPDVMDKTFAALVDSKCGKIEIQPIQTSNGIERVIISARLGVKTPSKLFVAINK